MSKTSVIILSIIGLGVILLIGGIFQMLACLMGIFLGYIVVNLMEENE